MGKQGGKQGGKPVYRITGVRPALSADVGFRQRRYLISMGIRTVCFVLAVATWGWLGHMWLSWVFLIGALTLPYISVVMANGGREPSEDVPDTLFVDEPDSDRPQLPGPRQSGDGRV